MGRQTQAAAAPLAGLGSVGLSPPSGWGNCCPGPGRAGRVPAAQDARPGRLRVRWRQKQAGGPPWGPRRTPTSARDSVDGFGGPKPPKPPPASEAFAAPSGDKRPPRRAAPGTAPPRAKALRLAASASAPRSTTARLSGASLSSSRALSSIGTGPQDPHGLRSGFPTARGAQAPPGYVCVGDTSGHTQIRSGPGPITQPLGECAFQTSTAHPCRPNLVALAGNWAALGPQACALSLGFGTPCDSHVPAHLLTGAMP